MRDDWSIRSIPAIQLNTPTSGEKYLQAKEVNVSLRVCIDNFDFYLSVYLHVGKGFLVERVRKTLCSFDL